LANENFVYKNKHGYVEFENPDNDDEILIEMDMIRNFGINRIYLPRAKAIELRDWLSKVLEEEK